MSSTADLKAQKRQKFEKVFEVIREELLTHFNGEGMPKEASEWYRQVRTISFLPSFFFFFFEIYLWRVELGLQCPWWKTESRDLCCRFG